MYIDSDNIFDAITSFSGYYRSYISSNSRYVYGREECGKVIALIDISRYTYYVTEYGDHFRTDCYTLI